MGDEQQARTCAAEVYRDGQFRSSPCSRRGVVFENGAWWCRQHAPSAVLARRKKSSARWKERLAVAAIARVRNGAYQLEKWGHVGLARKVRRVADHEEGKL